MEENYINIFTSFLADLLKKEQLSLSDVIFLVKEFEPVADNIKSRNDLANFLNVYIKQYQSLQELKDLLLNNKHRFINPEMI